MLYWALVFLVIALVAGPSWLRRSRRRVRGHREDSLLHFPRAAFGFACDSLSERAARFLDRELGNGQKIFPKRFQIR